MKMKMKIDGLRIDGDALERVAREAVEAALEEEGVDGECPLCGAPMTLRAPACTCPSCGGEVVPRVG